MTTYRWSFAEDVLGCERTGIERLGVWRRKLEEFGVERAVELLSDHNVAASSLSWAGGFTGGMGMTFDEAVDDTRTAIFQAAAIGARTLHIVSGPRGGHIHSHARRLLFDGLSATVDIAAEHGITLALQPMTATYADEWTFLDSFEQASQIVEDINHPFLGIAFGTSHFLDEPELLAKIRRWAYLFRSVQLSDCRHPAGEFERLVPGDGEVPFADIAQALHEGGYRGDFEIDIWSSDLWRSNDYESVIGRSAANMSSLLRISSPAPAFHS